MLARIIGVAVAAAAVGESAFAQLAATTPPQPWAEQVQVGVDYRGEFGPDDPRIVLGDRQVPVKCTVVPSNENDGFDLTIRQTGDNKIVNLVNLSLQLQIGTGSCTDFKMIRFSWYDPSALPISDNGRVRFYSGGGGYVVRVLTVAREPEKDPFVLKVRKLAPSVRASKFAAGSPASSLSGPAAPGLAGDTVEAARTAYLQMCGKGQEKLSAATCAGMRRDLDTAVAAQTAAAREAEVMGVYRQLCAPSARKLSEDTCASMLTEAKQTLAAGPPPPAAAPSRRAEQASAAAEVRSAHDELCAPGAQQVSVETCAALKADAAPAHRRR